MCKPSVSLNDEKRVLISITKHKHAVRNKAVFMLALYAGLRAKEIASLKMSNIFEPDFTIKAAIQLTTTQAKNSKSRVIPISKKLAVALIELLSVVKHKHLTAALIQSQQHDKFSPNTISQLLLTIFRRANLTSYSAHSLRRTFITRLANNAINLRVVQILVSHSSLATTQRYIDVQDSQMFNAVNTL